MEEKQGGGRQGGGRVSPEPTQGGGRSYTIKLKDKHLKELDDAIQILKKIKKKLGE